MFVHDKMLVRAALGESLPMNHVYAAHGMGAPRSGGRAAESGAPSK